MWSTRSGGFSVWESQLEKEHRRGVTPGDMQLGVRNAAVVILLLTPGIFHAERHFVWKTEIKYALEECLHSYSCSYSYLIMQKENILRLYVFSAVIKEFDNCLCVFPTILVLDIS